MAKGKQGGIQIKMIKIVCAALLPFAVLSYVYSQTWVRTYDGPAQGMDNSYAIALDPTGNVLTTGYVSMPHDGETIPNYCTIKYTPDGELQWVRFFDCGFGLAIASDSSANVYVTGENVTIKYAPNGDVVWVRTYGDNFWGSAIVTDQQGSAYVTGYIGDYPDRFAITIKYNSRGQEEWVKIDSIGVWCVSIALDTTGNVYVAGFGRQQILSYLVMKYSPDGELLWRRGENIHGSIYKLQLSKEGDVYVTGSLSDEIGYPITIVTVKYNTRGEEQWVRFFDGPGYDIGQTLTIDQDGNCCVAGGTAEHPGIQSNYDIIVIKYDHEGTELWQRRYTGFGSDDYPFAIGADSRKNVYVGGYSKAPRDTSYWADDYLLLKYDSAGNLVWEARYFVDSLGGWLYDLAIDLQDYIYTTGYVATGTRNDLDYDWCTIKYPSTGPGVSEMANSLPPKNQRGKVHPNPARNEGLITLPKSITELKLYDPGGRLVKTLTARQDKIALSGVKSGVYLLRWQREKEWVSAKLVIR